MTLDVWLDKMKIIANPSGPTEEAGKGKAKEGVDLSSPPESEEIFFNEFKANPPDQPRTWELENTGI